MTVLSRAAPSGPRRTPRNPGTATRGGRWLRLALLMVVIPAACGDDGVSPEEEDPLTAFVGSWSASSFVYTSVDDPGTAVPVLQVVPGSSVDVTVQPGGAFEAALNLGEQTGGGTEVIPGTIEHEGDDRITVTFAPNPFFTEPLDVTYSFQTQNTLSWETSTTFDFNQDGEATPAILTVVFQRT